MKMKEIHFEAIQNHILNVLKTNNLTFSECLENVKKAKKYVSDPAKSTIWMIAYAAAINWNNERMNFSKFISKELYPYINDKHIDTAMRKIIKNIK